MSFPELALHPGKGNIYWNDQPGLATLSFDSSGVVRRRVEYRHCRFEDAVVVARVPCRNGFTLYASNVFSPNGDGRNDFFELSGADLEVLELQIFDRWGNRLFQEKSPAGGARWDGEWQYRPYRGEAIGSGGGK